MEIIFLFLTTVYNNIRPIAEYLFLIFWIILIWKSKISGKKTAISGFILLSITMMLSIVQQDDAAGIIAGFVWILFAISFIQEFYHFLKYENK